MRPEFNTLAGLLHQVIEKVDTISNKVDKLSNVTDEVRTIAINSAGDIKNLQDDLDVVVHHSTENFDKNEEQDKRLDRLEGHLKLPKLSFA